jgi:hypothetical protein
MIEYWWQVGDQKFNNKWKAELVAQKNNLYSSFETDHETYIKAIEQLNFNDNEEYEIEYVKKLRKKYNHIRLYYTGGFDSHTILKYFLDNNILIDETTIVWSGPKKNDKTSFCDKEYLLSASAFLEKNKHHIKKITNLHNDIERLEKFYKNPNWFLECRGGYTYMRLHSANFEWFDEYNNSSQCNIVGKEKPRLLKLGKKWYATVIDNTLLDWMGMPNKLDFWLDPENIGSFIKDARLFRNYIKKNETVKENDFFSFEYKGEKFVESSLAINRRNVPDQITGKNSMSKAARGLWCNEKDKALLYELIDKNHILLVTNYFHSWHNLKSLFPKQVAHNSIQRHPVGKFPWFIDIDDMTYHPSKELDVSKVFKNN